MATSAADCPPQDCADNRGVFDSGPEVVGSAPVDAGEHVLGEGAIFMGCLDFLSVPRKSVAHAFAGGLRRCPPERVIRVLAGPETGCRKDRKTASGLYMRTPRWASPFAASLKNRRFTGSVFIPRYFAKTPASVGGPDTESCSAVIPSDGPAATVGR
jgi:hypothetical protein